MLVFVLVFVTLCPFYVCNNLNEEERAGCLAFIDFHMPCYCKCLVALPDSALSWSALCDCDLS